MKRQDFCVQGGYYFDTLAEAVKEASRRAARDGSDMKVYQAVKLVCPKSPEVDITDIVIA